MRNKAGSALSLNSRWRLLFAAAFLVAAALAAGPLANAAVYKYTQIDVPFPGATETFTRGINDAGQIVGYFACRRRLPRLSRHRGELHPTRLAQPTYDLNVYVSPRHQRYGGDRREYNLSECVRSSDDSGFLYTGGTFTRLAVPGASSTSPQSINDSGQIVGYYVSGRSRGFLYSGGTFTQIDVPGAPDTYAYGINNLGQMVGSVSAVGGEQGFLYTGGSFTQIDVPFAASFGTSPQGINEAGQIVGSFFDSQTSYPGGDHGFLYGSGTFTQLAGIIHRG